MVADEAWEREQRFDHPLLTAMEDALENKPVTRGNPAWRRGGPSPNPGGRPKGLAALVREQTDDGAELVAFMLRVLRSKRQPMRLRMDAVAWLADRGFGKVPMPLEHAGAAGAPLTFTLLLSPPPGAAEGDE